MITSNIKINLQLPFRANNLRRSFPAQKFSLPNLFLNISEHAPPYLTQKLGFSYDNTGNSL
jgi:hypothetical protein